MKKLIVTTKSTDDIRQIESAGCEILATYPNCVLAGCDEAKLGRLERTGLELSEMGEQEISLSGATFSLPNALEAEKREPAVLEKARRAYFIVRMVGPVKGEWLRAIERLDGHIQGTAQGPTLIVGFMPERVAEAQALPWVEAVTPYRPTMKVSPKLRSGVGRKLSVDRLVALEDEAPAESSAGREVQISVFSGESGADVAKSVRDAGGTVLDERERSVTAWLPSGVLAGLANHPAIQSILPHTAPRLFNDQAAAVMGVPSDHTFEDLTLTGAGQVVAVADSGLDTGAIATVHQDFAGRVDAIQSLPVIPEANDLTTDPPSTDDGAQDANSGHGTHVAGSVLGDGAAAIAAGSTTVPRGTAPDARLYFQAHEQTVNWKSTAQLIFEGVNPGSIPDWWPPPAVGLYGIPVDLNDLFTPAYAAGARIHTNSWGSDEAGEYTERARAVDEFMWNNRDMLIVFAAGNEGVDDDGNGMIDEDSVGPPGTAKNCLTVGASENTRPSGSTPTPGIDADWDDLVDSATGDAAWPAMGAAGHVSDDEDGMAVFSSRGPTDDGRIKPDVVAPGTNVLSTRSSAYAGTTDPLWGDLAPADPLSGLYCWSGGTSMAAPLVAGGAALVREHLVAGRGHVQDGVSPSGALLKAFIVNGAVPMPGQFAGEVPAGPNDVSGFGRANLTESLTPGALKRTLFADEPEYAVETGETRTFEVKVIDPAVPLKVTLAWTDAPAPEGVGGLSNELYLQVVPPGGTPIDGDVTPYPTVSNNVQQVSIASPAAAGNYEIRVRGVSIVEHSPGAPAGADPRQDFAIVVSNGMGMSLKPVSIAQAIDTTGSMDYFGYMEPAQERARQLVDFMRINDKVAITEFSQRTAVVDDARTVYPLRLLGAHDPDWTDAYTEIGNLVSSGRTPIGAGLQEAWNQLSGEPASRPRAIVLLSDGLNNEPPTPATVLPGIPADVPIFSIALGPAGSEPTLQNIASSRPDGGYFVVESDEDIHKLHEIYAQVQALTADMSLVGLQSSTVGMKDPEEQVMPIEPEASEATFTLSWDPAAALKGMEFELRDPSGNVRNRKTEATLEHQSKGYHVVRVAAPAPGSWTCRVTNLGSRSPVPYTISAATRSGLRLLAGKWEIDRERVSHLVWLEGPHKALSGAQAIANATIPVVSRTEIWKRYSAKIAKTVVPKAVLEKGLTKEQLMLLQLSLFERKMGEKLERTQRLQVKPVATKGGLWRIDVPLKVAGNVTFDVSLEGTLDGHPWRRQIVQSIHVPQEWEKGYISRGDSLGKVSRLRVASSNTTRRRASVS